jgi:hypothetical protein
VSTQHAVLLRLREKALKGDARSLDRFRGRDTLGGAVGIGATGRREGPWSVSAHQRDRLHGWGSWMRLELFALIRQQKFGPSLRRSGRSNSDWGRYQDTAEKPLASASTRQCHSTRGGFVRYPMIG